MIKKYAPRFSEGNQEDIQEFLIYILDIIHEDLNRVYRTNNPEIPGNNGSNNNAEGIQIEIQEIAYKKEQGTNANLKELELTAAKEWQSYLRQNRSIVVDLFQVLI